MNEFYEEILTGFVMGIVVCNFFPTWKWLRDRIGGSPRLTDDQSVLLEEGKVKKGGVNEPPTRPKPKTAPPGQRPHVRWLEDGTRQEPEQGK